MRQASFPGHIRQPVIHQNKIRKLPEIFEQTAIGNKGVNLKLGGLNAAEYIIYSFNYKYVVDHIEKGDWDLISALVTTAALKLKTGGAEAIIICANTVHKIADEIQGSVGLPVIHIGRETAQVIKNKHLNKFALLGPNQLWSCPFLKIF